MADHPAVVGAEAAAKAVVDRDGNTISSPSVVPVGTNTPSLAVASAEANAAGANATGNSHILSAVGPDGANTAAVAAGSGNNNIFRAVGNANTNVAGANDTGNSQVSSAVAADGNNTHFPVVGNANTNIVAGIDTTNSEVVPSAGSGDVTMTDFDGSVINNPSAADDNGNSHVLTNGSDDDNLMDIDDDDDDNVVPTPYGNGNVVPLTDFGAAPVNPAVTGNMTIVPSARASGNARTTTAHKRRKGKHYDQTQAIPRDEPCDACVTRMMTSDDLKYVPCHEPHGSGFKCAQCSVEVYGRCDCKNVPIEVEPSAHALQQAMIEYLKDPTDPDLSDALEAARAAVIAARKVAAKNKSGPRWSDKSEARRRGRVTAQTPASARLSPPRAPSTPPSAAAAASTVVGPAASSTGQEEVSEALDGFTTEHLLQEMASRAVRGRLSEIDSADIWAEVGRRTGWRKA